MKKPTQLAPSITIKTLYPAISKKSSCVTALIKIVHPPMPRLEHKRKELNIAFCLDISGSMMLSLKSQHLDRSAQSKLERVKNATIKAIGLLQDTDFFSITVFNNEAKVLLPSTQATAIMKVRAQLLIHQLQACSSTALYAGWKSAVSEVILHMKPTYVNRALLLTDGQATDGLRDVESLSSAAKTMASHGVSTSTFGVGDAYDETLLQAMADHGDGRYFYMDADTNFQEMFEQEFKGMANTYGKNARLSLVHRVEDEVTLHNALVKDDDGWKLPDAMHGRTEFYLVSFNPVLKKDKDISFCVEYEYTGDDRVHLVQMSHTVSVVSNKAFEGMLQDGEVALKKLELDAALAKEQATAALDLGDYAASRLILKASVCSIMASAHKDSPEMKANVSRLESLMSVGDSGDHVKLRKMSTSDTYTTRNNY